MTGLMRPVSPVTGYRRPRRGWGASCLLLLSAGCVATLVCGASLLGANLPGGLPLGNLLAAGALCSAAGAAFVHATQGTWRRAAARLSLLAAASWLPVSVALAGNLALDFAGARGTAWLYFSAGVATAVLGTLLWALACALRDLVPA